MENNFVLAENLWIFHENLIKCNSVVIKNSFQTGMWEGSPLLILIPVPLQSNEKFKCGLFGVVWKNLDKKPCTPNKNFRRPKTFLSKFAFIKIKRSKSVSATKHSTPTLISNYILYKIMLD